MEESILFFGFEFIILGLAALGLIIILKGLYSKSSGSESLPKFEIVIIVRNAQSQIEGIVRCFYQNTKGTRELWIIDRGSTDQTPNILEKLATQFAGLNTLLLSDMSLKASIQEVMRYINTPAVMFVDADNLSFLDIINLTNIARGQKSVEIGLKTYAN